MRSIRTRLPYTTLSVLAALVLACAVFLMQLDRSSYATDYLDPPRQNQGEPSLIITWWIVNAFRNSEGRLVPFAYPDPIPLGAMFDGRRMSGTSGCNAYQLDYETLEGRIRLFNLNQTLVACGDNREERDYFADLANVDHYTIANRRLLLQDATGMVLAEFVAVDSAPLIGTAWQVYQYGNEFGKSWVFNNARATMALQPDGQVVGQAICHEYRAPYRIDGPTRTGSDVTLAEVRIGDVTTTGDRLCNPDQLEEEADYFAAMRKASTFMVMSNMLCLRDAYGQWVATFVFNRGFLPAACNAAR